MLRKLALGAMSGYLLKTVQVVCNLILIPFLVSDAILTLGGYGALAVLIASIGLIQTALDGWRLSTARRFGLAKNNNEAIYVPLLIITIIPLILTGFVMIPLGESVLRFVGVIEYQEKGMLLLLWLYLLLEELNILPEQYIHSVGKTWFVNVVLLFEVLIRTAALFVLLPDQPSISTYFTVFSGLMALKFVAYNFLMAALGQFNSFKLSHIKQEWPTFCESLPLSLKSLSVYSVFRATVIVVNKMFSAEIAAIYSILMVTIRGYITQLFVSVIRPMVVPLMSSVDISRLEDQKKLLIDMSLNLFSFIVVVFCLIFSVSVFIWFPLWLNLDVTYYGIYIAVGIMLLGLEASVSIQNLLLVSQGYGVALTKSITAAAGVYILYLMALYFGFNNPAVGWYFSGVFIYTYITSAMIVPWLFREKIMSERTGANSKQAGFYVVIIIILVLVNNLGMAYQRIAMSLMVFVISFVGYLLFVYNPAEDEQLKNNIGYMMRKL